MGKKLDVGDKVICQYYNTPDKRFYGEIFDAEIIEIQNKTYPNYTSCRDFVVRRADDDRLLTIWRKEILRRKNG